MAGHMRRSTQTPGDTLRATIAAKGWNQKTLARILGRPVAVVCEIVNGKKAITAETAWQLEYAGLGDALYWLILQAAHELQTKMPRGLALVKHRAHTEKNARRGRPKKASA